MLASRVRRLRLEVALVVVVVVVIRDVVKLFLIKFNVNKVVFN